MSFIVTVPGCILCVETTHLGDGRTDKEPGISYSLDLIMSISSHYLSPSPSKPNSSLVDCDPCRLESGFLSILPAFINSVRRALINVYFLVNFVIF